MNPPYNRTSITYSQFSAPRPAIGLVLLALLAILCIAALPGNAAAAAPQKRILVIQSYHPDLDWTRLCDQGIRKILGPSNEITTVYMDTKRLHPLKFDARAQEAWQAYLDLAPDLVMLGDDNALRLLGRRFAATDTPVVFFGINNNPRAYFNQLPSNITGLLERTPLFEWLRYLREIMPQARRALVLMDATISSTGIRNATFQHREEISVSGMLTHYRVAGTWKQWQKAVQNAKDYDLIVSSAFHAVRNMQTGTNINEQELIRWTSENSKVPLFTNQDYSVGPMGAAGAYALMPGAHGTQAARIALSILEEGLSPKNIPFEVDRVGLFVFNREQLDRFGIILPQSIEERVVWQ